MEFRLMMTCDNDAFTEDTAAEVARILRTVAARLVAESEVPGAPISGRCMDANGNSVGTFSLQD